MIKIFALTYDTCNPTTNKLSFLSTYPSITVPSKQDKIIKPELVTCEGAMNTIHCSMEKISFMFLEALLVTFR